MRIFVWALALFCLLTPLIASQAFAVPVLVTLDGTVALSNESIAKGISDTAGLDGATFIFSMIMDTEDAPVETEYNSDSGYTSALYQPSSATLSLFNRPSLPDVEINFTDGAAVTLTNVHGQTDSGKDEAEFYFETGFLENLYINGELFSASAYASRTFNHSQPTGSVWNGTVFETIWGVQDVFPEDDVPTLLGPLMNDGSWGSTLYMIPKFDGWVHDSDGNGVFGDYYELGPDFQLNYVEGSDARYVVSDWGSFEFSALPTPLPPAFWFLGTGLLGLIGVRRKK